MGRIFINSVNETQVRSVVQDELALNPPSSQLPFYASPPSGFTNGQMYKNTTDGLVYVMTTSGFKQMDVKDNEVQDIFGTTLLID